MIHDALAFAVAYCGLSPEQFRALTVEEWEAIAAAVKRREEQRLQNGWEQARVMAYSAISPYLERGTTPQGFLPFDWDNPPEELESTVALPSAEERAAMIARYTGRTDHTPTRDES